MADPADIETRIAYLSDAYGDVPVESGTYYHDESAFERVRDNHECGRPGGARVWVEREGEALLVRTHGGLDGWGVAGGLIEPDERSDDAGEREILEETGIECNITDVAYAHIAKNRRESEREAAEPDTIEELAVAFIAISVGGEIDIQDEEIRAARWWDHVPADSYPPASRIGPERL